MNLKNNKGYVITDVSIAIIILLILIPVIMGLVYGIDTSKLSSEIKSEAINIAINTIEAAKGLPIEEVTPSNILTELSNMEAFEDYDIRNIDTKTVIEAKKANYELEINVVDYNTTNNNANPNVVKTVTATVTYKIKGTEKNIELSTVVK